VAGTITYDYGFRIYSPALGKFLSVDPLSKSYSFYTPYQFAGNSPIAAIDLDGEEPKWMIDATGKLTKPMVTLLNAAFGYGKNMAKIPWRAINKDSYPYFGQALGTSGLSLDKHFNWNAQWMNLFEIKEPMEWISMWANLVVHEGKHMDDMNKYSVPLFYIWYGISTAIAEVETPDIEPPGAKKSFYNAKSFWEKRAYDIEDAPTIALFNLENGLALKVLKSDYDENLKSAVLKYVGKAFQLEQIKTQKENANGAKLKRLEKKEAKLQKQVDKANTKEVQEARRKLDTEPQESIKKPKTKAEYKDEADKQKTGG
jgi:hypothetical protein